MQAQRPHLDRDRGDVEQGVADILNQSHLKMHHAAPQAAPPKWLVEWETRRPVWLMECIAEATGVFFYTYCGMAASASWYVNTVAKNEGWGSLQTVGMAYGMGIVLGLICSVPTSGGHLSPAYTIAFWAFRGFPSRKVPAYILSQIFGAFIASLCVYAQYRPQFVEIAEGMRLAGEGALIFTPLGPAGIPALFPTQTGMRWIFLNELTCTVVLAVLVFSVLDGSNFLISMISAPFIFGFAYMVIIWSFSSPTLALNTARDLGGRMACVSIYGHQCFTSSSSYTAIAALTNILGTLLGALFQTLFLSDTARLVVLSNLPPAARAGLDAAGHKGEATMVRHLSRYSQANDLRSDLSVNGAKEGSNGSH